MALKEKLQGIASDIAERFLKDEATPLNDMVKKASVAQGLSPESVKRLVEMTNLDVYTKKMSKLGHRDIFFKTASVNEVLGQVNAPRVEKRASQGVSKPVLNLWQHCDTPIELTSGGKAVYQKPGKTMTKQATLRPIPKMKNLLNEELQQSKLAAEKLDYTMFKLTEGIVEKRKDAGFKLAKQAERESLTLRELRHAFSQSQLTDMEKKAATSVLDYMQNEMGRALPSCLVPPGEILDDSPIHAMPKIFIADSSETVHLIKSIADDANKYIEAQKNYSTLQKLINKQQQIKAESVQRHFDKVMEDASR